MNKINQEIDIEKDKESPLNINQKKLQNEMIHFKEDILKELKNFERNYSEKYKSSNIIIDDKLEEFERKLENHNQRLFKISQIVVEDKTLKEKIEEISQDKIDIQDKLLKTSVKLDRLEKEYNKKIGDIDNLLNDSVIYPGIIGKKARFINFHEFIDYILSQIAKFTVAFQKNISEINSIKSRLESSIKNIKIDAEGNLRSANQYTRQSVIESENRIKEVINILENNLKEIKEENEKNKKNIEQYNNETRNELKKEMESQKIKYKEENNKIDQKISDYEKQLNGLKDSYNKLNEEFNEKINVNEENQKEEKQKEENNKDLNDKNYQIDENEIVNKYLRGEINDNQFLIYKELMKLSSFIKNFSFDILEKTPKSIRKRYSIKNRNYSGNNLVSHLNSCFNNIISEISMERTKRRTVSNLLHCINLKLIDKKNRNEKEQNNVFPKIKIRKNSSTIGFKTFDLSNDMKIKTSENNNQMNEIGYKTFQMNNRKFYFKVMNSEVSKKNINEEIANEEPNIIKEEEEKSGKKNELENLTDINDFKEIKINNEKNNIIIEFEKNKNEELKVKEYNNKISNTIKNKISVNKTTNIKKELINKILKNSIENENSSNRKIKDNIIYKINNNRKKEEESKQAKKLNNTISRRGELYNKIEPQTIRVTTFQPFKGKKYLGYEKSFDAKVKEKLISYDFDYKEKMKKYREMGFYNDFHFVPNENIMLPKTKKRIEVENIQKMVNNLNSYIGENSFKNKYFFQRNNFYDISQSTSKLRDSLFDKNNLFG